MFLVALNVLETGRCHSHLAFSEKGNWEPLWNKGFTSVGATTQKTGTWQDLNRWWIMWPKGFLSVWGCVKYQAMRTRWWSSACARETPTLQKWILWSSWKSRRLGALILKKGVSRVEWGSKECWHCEQKNNWKTVLYSCSVNKLNYLEYIPSFVIGFSSYTDIVTRNFFVYARYSSALLHYSFPFPICPVSSH